MDRTYDQRPLSDEPWRLSESDRALVSAKPKRARLEFAVLLLFFRAHGRFPRAGADIAPALVARVARQLGLVSPMAMCRPVPLRTLKCYRAEIRARFGTRQATVRDADELFDWLRDHVVATTRDIDDLAGRLEAQCRTLGLEPPSENRARRIARSAVHAYDDQFCTRIHNHLPVVARERSDALLQASAVASAVAPLIWLRNDSGRPSLNSLREEMAKLDLLRSLRNLSR